MSRHCLHCGGAFQNHRQRFCSDFCEHEDKNDRRVNWQRVNSFEALAEAGTWLRINNFSLSSLDNPTRKVKLLDRSQFSVNDKTFISYRLTPAGYRLLERWKQSIQL